MAKREKVPVPKMTREEILSTVEFFPTETKIKAWLMRIDDKHYQISVYGGVYRVLPRVSIWQANKKGKRIGDPIFTINGQDKDKCIGMFLDSMEAEEARIKAEADEAKFNEDLAKEQAEYEASINAELDQEMKLSETNPE